MWNFLALEGAKEHFGASLPKDNEVFDRLHTQIKENGYPCRWSKKNCTYEDATIKGNSNCEKSWHCLEVIRNNLFHANKAMEPESNERLLFLLKWSRD